jgi:hypothetical protein
MSLRGEKIEQPEAKTQDLKQGKKNGKNAWNPYSEAHLENLAILISVALVYRMPFVSISH